MDCETKDKKRLGNPGLRIKINPQNGTHLGHTASLKEGGVNSSLFLQNLLGNSRVDLIVLSGS